MIYHHAPRVPSTPLSKGKQLKILTPNKLLIRLSMLLAQIKVENNPNKLKIKVRQIMYLLYQHNKMTIIR